MATLRKLLVFTALTFCAVVAGQAQITNGGFETGNFSGWNTIGVTAVNSTFSGQTPIEGNFQAALTTNTSGTVTQTSLENFLGLTAGTLNSQSFGSANRGGSAISQTFTVPAGASIQFSWDFFPNGSNTSQNDRAFYTLHLAATPSNSITLLDQVSNHPTGTPSGYTTLASGPLAAGTYILGIAVYDLAFSGSPSNSQDPALLVDRLVIVPEPSTWALLIVGGTFTTALMLRRRLA